MRNGFGRHDVFIPEENHLPLRKLEYSFSILYNPILMTTKSSILIFYLTLAEGRRVFQWGCWGTMAIVICAGFSLTIANALQCVPVWAELVEPVPGYAHCTDIITLYLSSAPVHISTDLMILALPIPIITQMRLPRKQKIILVVTFSFGAFVAAVDVVRIAYLEQAFQIQFSSDGAGRVSITDDFSWSASLCFLWSAVEVHVGIICACVPSLKPLVAKTLPNLLRDTKEPHDVSGMMSSAHGIGAGGGMVNVADFGQSSPRNAGLLGITGLPSNPKDKEYEDTRLSKEINGLNESQPQKSSQDEIGLMDFLTTPEMRSPKLNRASTALTNTTHKTTATNFGFYSMDSKKPMTKLSNKESILPLAYVTILFFVWGCAYGFLNILNSRFATVAGFGSGQMVGTHAAYYAGYAIGPFLPGWWVLKRGGFKATFVAGLCIYAAGTLVFWPAAVLLSFPAFIVSNLIVGIGVSVLEVGANPFIALCGPCAYSEARLNISQGVQAIGTVLAPLLAERVLFRTVTDTTSLINVQWTYLGLSLFAVALAVIFSYLQIPEASDEDFAEIAEKRSTVYSTLIFGKITVVHLTLALGVFAQFCYVGAQEAASVAYTGYINTVDTNSQLDAFDWQTVGHTVFAVGRFLCAALQLFMKPRRILLLLFIGMIITSALCMSLTGQSAIAALTLYELFQSGVFSFIYAISLRGLGSHTKIGAVWLSAAICGGAIFPVIRNPVINGQGYSYSFCIVLAPVVFGALFPLYLEAVPAAKKQVDPIYQHKPVLPVQQGDEPRTDSRGSFTSNLSEKVKSRFKRNREDTVVEHIDG